MYEPTGFGAVSVEHVRSLMELELRPVRDAYIWPRLIGEHSARGRATAVYHDSPFMQSCAPRRPQEQPDSAAAIFGHDTRRSATASQSDIHRISGPQNITGEQDEGPCNGDPDRPEYQS